MAPLCISSLLCLTSRHLPHGMLRPCHDHASPRSAAQSVYLSIVKLLQESTRTVFYPIIHPPRHPTTNIKQAQAQSSSNPCPARIWAGHDLSRPFPSLLNLVSYRLAPSSFPLLFLHVHDFTPFFPFFLVLVSCITKEGVPLGWLRDDLWLGWVGLSGSGIGGDKEGPYGIEGRA